MASINDLFDLKWWSGTKERKYRGDLYDPKERSKWSGREEEGYNLLGEDRDRFRRLSDEALGRSRESFTEADRYLGMGAGLYQDAVGDVNAARTTTGEVRDMLSDSGYYRNLRDRLRTQQQEKDVIRREMQGLRSNLDSPYEPGALGTSLMDAFKVLKTEQEKSINKEIAQIARDNPAAAVRMKNDFNTNMIKLLGKTQQQGFFGDKQADLNQIAVESNLLLSENNLVNEAEASILRENAVRDQQISGKMGVVGQYLNTAAGRMSAGAGLTGIGSAYEGRGRGMQNVASGYDNAASGALGERINMASANRAIQDKYRLSDRNVRQSVDDFNDSRGAMGLKNLFSLGKMATDIYTGGATATIPGPQPPGGKEPRKDTGTGWKSWLPGSTGEGWWQDNPNEGWWDTRNKTSKYKQWGE